MTESVPERGFVQLLTPEGERVHDTDYDVELSDDEYRGFFRDLVLVRRVDAEATALQRQGQLGLWASLLGQEAAQIGSGRALRPQDMAFPTYREHGVAWCRGVDPLHALRMFRGVDLGAADPHEHNFAMYAIVIGAQCLHATGYAMGVQKDGRVGNGDGEAVIAYLGDGATSQGDVNEAFVWAAAFAAPVVFFCQNNQYAISAPTDRQTRVPLYRRAAGFGFPGVRVDGNDVLATYAVTRRALDDARHGQGPAFIEAFTYRMGAHTTSDDPTRYRIAAELEEWRLRDPIERLRSFLVRQQLAGPDFFDEIDAEADELAARVRKGCLELPDPAPETIFDHVYANPTAPLEAQRETFRAYSSEFLASGDETERSTVPRREGSRR
ncbi:pyruvate dehydrogenase (acetyl-transferring) E1 component subunit alpha [Cryptosporangium phraense]|uniref:Pyruvate dehydrogenase (Acetyl-transferring) E1 component subunit alpha n=1 Tax=Cryptosporangium phraense TaxID=2593070 RepID=A0A545AF90_9ACTN|nr:pyruvate dehydrogenase (acetyl-transferring) E1 component subunit alpha [Cryptosporangium phraense]TQS39973.1 pyruvate dehydrogenase (acetyl-transferring) E1 component subunit alpha [Cryptosporangium phraense]